MNTPATAALDDALAIEAPGDGFAVAMAAVPMAWLLIATLLTVAAWLGFSPFLTPADVNLSEAAATRDHLEILREIEAGADPNQAARVRANLVRDSEYVLTPLQAAVASGRLDTVEFLQHHGARVDATTLPGLICFARVQDASEIAAYLEQQAPAGFVLHCEGVPLPWTD